MAHYMGAHGSGPSHHDKDLNAMMLPQTSMNRNNEMLSPVSEGPLGLTSPGYMGHRVSTGSGTDYSMGPSSQGPGYMSHSALTGLAAAAAHHARFSSSGMSPEAGPRNNTNSNLMQGLGSPPSQGQGQGPGPGQGQGPQGHTPPGHTQGHATPQQMSPGASSGGSGGLEMSDMGSGGATLSISYMRQGDNYVCSLCGKTVASKAAITRHIQLTHEKKKPFECNICHRRFGYKNILLEHQNIHFGIKPYSCNLCDKRFAARSNLFQHRLLHMKPFHCEVCNKRFDRADQLQRHLKLHPTSNLLSCNLCNFQATNVEALNHHLKENHTLQTFNTRSRFGSFDGDPPSQVPMSGANALALTLESEAMRKIDTICSQLASKTHHVIKSEPMSPSFAQHHGGFPPMSPSTSLSSPPFSAGSEAANFSSGMFTGAGNPSQSPHQREDSITITSPRTHHHEQGSYTGDSPTSSVSSAPGFSMQQRPGAGQFLTPSRRAASVGSIPGIQAFSRQNRSGPPPSPLPNYPQGNNSSSSVRSSADSTTNLSEFFSILQGMIQRSQDIPELSVLISRRKSLQDAGVQHSTSNLTPGDVPALHDVLVYYESQGKIYRCPHCKIWFEERGLYFLHKSLHGEQSPWECSICHKICADKNDFHLHFVNEQHQGQEYL